MINKKSKIKSFEENSEVLNRASKSRFMRLKSHFRGHTKAYLLPGLVIGLGIGMSEAMAFDLDAAGKGITEPIKAFIDSYWPAGVIAMASGGAVMAQGDMRTRAFGFGAGALLGGVMMTGVKLGLGV